MNRELQIIDNMLEIKNLINRESLVMPMDNIMPMSFLGMGGSAIISILCHFNYNIDAAILFALILVLGSIMSIKLIKDRKIRTRKINFLYEKLHDEEVKLDKLENGEITDIHREEILSPSIQIEIIEKRLNDIEHYMKIKHEIIKLYKNGILKDVLFEGGVNEDTINFIIKLVENDLGIENINKNKQKTLTKRS